MPTRTHVFRSLIQRLSGTRDYSADNAETVFRAFGENVEKRLRETAGKTRRTPRRTVKRGTSQ